MKILYVNDTNAQHFDNENKKHPVFAKYFSPTCPACIAMESEWDDMCKDIDKKYNTDMIMAQIDPQGMNKLEGMKTHSDVAYVPSIMILKNGQKVKEYEGEKRKDKMLQFLLDNGLIKPKRGGSCSKARQHKSRKSRKSRTSKTKRIYRKTPALSNRRKRRKSVRRKKSNK
jgi:thioredoxin-like negative regulator of GroEL